MPKSAFIDEVEITVAGGRGGNGIVSFLRERARPFGGPNGGDGGAGGGVYLEATTGVNTLSSFRYQRRIFAKNGANGGSGNCRGANGEDVVRLVPVGTRVVDCAGGYLHADLTEIGARALVAAGGRGGFGNAHYKSSVNRAPRMATKGEAGEERQFKLELKLMADVGLLGLPNAGKSTFLRAISAARPKVAAYPFTTLSPQLGWVELARGEGAIVVADIPGIIRGAADGAGLGNRFLRHLSRAALLCHIVDASSARAVDDCREVADELRRAADESLAQKPRWLLLNKIDLLSADERRGQMAALRAACPDYEEVLAISALTGEGARECVSRLIRRQDNQDKGDSQDSQHSQHKQEEQNTSAAATGARAAG